MDSAPTATFLQHRLPTVHHSCPNCWYALHLFGIEPADSTVFGVETAERLAMALRAFVFVIIGLLLGGCMQETLEPATQAGWTTRDKQLMAHLPYAQATIPEEYRRH